VEVTRAGPLERLDELWDEGASREDLGALCVVWAYIRCGIESGSTLDDSTASRLLSEAKGAYAENA
jgi:hypothetical protein